MIVLGGQVTVEGVVVEEFSKMFEWRGSTVHYEGHCCELLTRLLRKF